MFAILVKASPTTTDNYGASGLFLVEEIVLVFVLHDSLLLASLTKAAPMRDNYGEVNFSKGKSIFIHIGRILSGGILSGVPFPVI